MTLDLNGTTLSGNGSRQIVVRGDGELTIVDNSTDGTGAITSNARPVHVDGGGKVILESGLIKSTNDCAIEVGAQTNNGGEVIINGGQVEAQEVAVLALYPGAKVEINGGTLTTTDNFVVGGNGNNGSGETDIVINGGELIGNITSAGYVACGIYHPQKGSLTINGGNITANGGAGIVMRGGEVTINGGNINATGDSSLTGKVGDSRIVVGPSAVVMDKAAKYYDADNMLLTISGEAKLIGSKTAVEAIVGDEQTVDGQIEITGGAFSDDVTEYVADGYTATKDSSTGLWIVA